MDSILYFIFFGGSHGEAITVFASRLMSILRGSRLWHSSVACSIRIYSYDPGRSCNGEVGILLRLAVRASDGQNCGWTWRHTNGNFNKLSMDIQNVEKWIVSKKLLRPYDMLVDYYSITHSQCAWECQIPTGYRRRRPCNAMYDVRDGFASRKRYNLFRVTTWNVS